MSNLCWNSIFVNKKSFVRILPAGSSFKNNKIRRSFSSYTKQMEATLSLFQPTSRVVRLLIQGSPERRIEIPLSAQEQRIFHIMLETVRVRNLGTKVRVAGGWVRDKLLGRANDDIDFAVDNMKGSEFAAHVVDFLNKVCPGPKTSSVGVIQANPVQSKHLETATTRILDMWLDFANLRTDIYFPDSRIPVTTIGTPKQDAERRDLTINAMFYNLSEETVEDFTGKGVSDLETGTIRTPLPPLETFLDDPLRVLRTVRFATRFGFKIEDTVRRAIIGGESSSTSSGVDSVLAALSTKVSRERVGIEVEAMLGGPRPISAVRLLYSLGLLPLVCMAVYPVEEVKKKNASVSTETQAPVADSIIPPLSRPDLKLMGRLTIPPVPPSFFSALPALYPYTEEGSLNTMISSELPDSWTEASMTVVESLDYLFNISPSFDVLCAISSTASASDILHLPPASSIGFCVHRDSLALTAPEAIIDHSTNSFFPPEARKILLLSAILYPLSNAFGLIGTSQRPDPLPGLVILHGLKLPSKFMSDVQSVLNGVHHFMIEADKIMNFDGLSPTHYHEMRLRVGQVLRREARDLWQLSLYLSATIHLSSVLFGPIKSSRGVETMVQGSSVLCIGKDAERQVVRVIEAHAKLFKLIKIPETEGGWGLDGCWGWKALLDGEAIAKITGAKGPEVGFINERQAEWRLLHPSGTEELCKDFVVKHSAEWIAQAKSEHEMTRAKLKAQVDAKAAASREKSKKPTTSQ
jgi:hypothetical protein